MADRDAIAFTPLYERISPFGDQNPYSNGGQIDKNAIIAIKEAVAGDSALFTPDYKDRI